MSEIVWGTCEGCGATLEFPEESSVGKCNYCGGQFMVVDPNEIHHHEETHFHEHYGTEGKSFTQLKYMKKMLEDDIKDICIEYLDKKTTAHYFAIEWINAINYRKAWGFRITLFGLFLILNGFHSLFFPIGIIVGIIGVLFFFSNPADEYSRYKVAQSDFDQLSSEIEDSYGEKTNKLEHIKNSMLNTA